MYVQLKIGNLQERKNKIQFQFSQFQFYYAIADPKVGEEHI